MSEGEDLEPQLKTAQAEAEQARREVAEARVRLGSIERDRQIRAERIRHVERRNRPLAKPAGERRSSKFRRSRLVSKRRADEIDADAGSAGSDRRPARHFAVGAVARR